jgi:hypothetical protein
MAGKPSPARPGRATHPKHHSPRHSNKVRGNTLGRGSGGAYSRAGPRAVRVAIETSAAGVAVPVDLPAPVPLDASTVPDPPAAAGDPVPDDIASAAVEAAASFGSDAEVTGGAAVADGWRVMVSVADPTGIRFPLVVHVDG